MITYLANQRLDGGMNARAARQQAFVRYLARDVQGSATHFSEVVQSSRSPLESLRAVRRMTAGLATVWSAGNPWVVVDYPNHPASVPRRLPVFLVACVYLGSLRTVCAMRRARIVVQSDDDPALQDACLSGVRLTRSQRFLERTYERLLFGSAKVLWFSGLTAGEMLCAELRVPHSRAVHVPNGAPDPEPVDVQLPEAGFRFAYAGALQPTTYGVCELVESFRAVRDPRARLLLLGPDGDWIARWAADAGEQRVRYLGCLPPEQMQSVLAECDAGVLVGKADGYYSTGFPGKLGAYVGAGLPVVTSCGGDPARFIHRHGTGVVSDEAALGSAMDSLVADPDRYGEMRANAQRLRGEVAWDSVFRRAVDDLRARYGPRYGHGRPVQGGAGDDGGRLRWHQFEGRAGAASGGRGERTAPSDEAAG